MGWSHLIDIGLARAGAECRLEKIEVAAFVGLLDVLGEHPPVASGEARRRRRPVRAPLGQFPLPTFSGVIRSRLWDPLQM